MRKNSAPPQASDLQLDLLLVLYEGARSSGDLATEVGTLRERAVPLATFYRQLQRTLDLGWVAFDDTDEAGPSGPGRPERHYRITAAGSQLLHDGMERLSRRVARGRAIGLLSEPTP